MNDQPSMPNPAAQPVPGPILVGEIMTSELKCLAPNEPFSAVLSLMANGPFRHVLVADSENRLRGVISDRDVLRALARTPDWNAKSVKEIMTSNPVTVTPASPISVAIKALRAMRINCLPVIGDDGLICGILTTSDLLKAYEKIQETLEGLAE